MKRKMLAASLLLWMFSLTAQADCAVLGPGKILRAGAGTDRLRVPVMTDCTLDQGQGSVRLPTRRLQMKKVLLAVFLLCSSLLPPRPRARFSAHPRTRAAGRCSVRRPANARVGSSGGASGSLEVACFNSPFPAPPYFSRSSIVASNVATKSASVDNSYIQ